MSRSDLPKVSVLLPAYNYERFVDESLASALTQDYPAERLEIIVVDDGSTDGTAPVVEGIVESNPGRIKFVRQQNSGQVATVARARAEASGELLAFLDADDVWLPQKTRKQVEAFQARPNVGLVFCDMTTIDADGLVVSASLYEQGEPNMDPVRLYARTLRSNVIYGGSSMYRADLFGDAPETIESWDWWLATCATERLAMGDLEVSFVPEPLALYRQHGNNMLLGAGGAKLIELRRRQLAYQLWALRRVNLTPLRPDDLLTVWGGPEWFAMTAAQATGSYFQELVSVTDQEREQAQALRSQAEQLRLEGDLAAEARLLLRALAWNPYEPDGFGLLREAVSRANAAAALPHPLAGARPFVVLADAEELLAGDEMLQAYVAAMADASDATLAVDATRMPPAEVVSQLQSLVSRCGLADRDDIDLLAVVDARDAAQRHRMHSAAGAFYSRSVAAASGGNANTAIPTFTPENLVELRLLAGGSGQSARR